MEHSLLENYKAFGQKSFFDNFLIQFFYNFERKRLIKINIKHYKAYEKGDLEKDCADRDNDSDSD